MVHSTGAEELTSRVTIGHDKHAVAALESSRSPNNLVHKTGKADGVGLRTVAVHYKIRIGDMALVIIALGVLSIPALGEHDLEAETIFAVGIEIGLVGHEMSVESALGRRSVVETVEAKGSLLKTVLTGLAQKAPMGLLRVRQAGVSRSISASRRLSSNHAEIRGVRFDVLRIKEIVPGRWSESAEAMHDS